MASGASSFQRADAGAIKLSVPKELITKEGACLDEEPPNLALRSLADHGYNLPQEMIQVSNNNNLLVLTTN